MTRYQALNNSVGRQDMGKVNQEDVFNIANIITGSRILFSIGLLLCPVFSVPFFTMYLAAGFSDMIDGAVARKTNTVTEFGSRLDTMADFVFVVVCLIKFLPVIDIPMWLSAWVGIIALIKGINIAFGYSARRKFVSVHTAMNKVTGVLLFVLPLTFPFIRLEFTTVFVCVIATFAAIQEGHHIRTAMAD